MACALAFFEPIDELRPTKIASEPLIAPKFLQALTSFSVTSLIEFCVMVVHADKAIALRARNIEVNFFIEASLVR